MKAIETHYKGYLFRSRLEARWAVFFDTLGLQWEYEPEGFELGGGVRYLPDFKVISPQRHVYWYEIKPAHIVFDNKVSLFCKHLHANRENEVIQDAQLLRGDPIEMFFERRYGQIGWLCPRCSGLSLQAPNYYYSWQKKVGFYCDCCDRCTPWEWESWRNGHPIKHGALAISAKHKGLLLVDHSEWQKMVNRIETAALAARSARFEWGKCPA